MTKDEILEILKIVSNKPSIKIPNQLGMVLIKGQLIISLPADITQNNMQTDAAAFEGWAIVLKRWIPRINQIIIKWNVPDLSSISKNNMQHYQRFLYRAKRCSEAYSWLEIAISNRKCFSHLIIENGKENILNTPSKERSRNFKVQKGLHEYSESELEEFILTDINVNKRFKQEFDLNIIDNQLPVGVFDGSKSNSTKIFTGGKSAIDIWGINNREEVCLFELKNSKNSKIGSLSEMLFYSFVIQDIVQGLMKFESTSYKGLKEITRAKKVKCYLLAPSTHPLIDKEVFHLLNKTKSGIEYGNVKISDNFTFSIL